MSLKHDDRLNTSRIVVATNANNGLYDTFSLTQNGPTSAKRDMGIAV